MEPLRGSGAFWPRCPAAGSPQPRSTCGAAGRARRSRAAPAASGSPGVAASFFSLVLVSHRPRCRGGRKGPPGCSPRPVAPGCGAGVRGEHGRLRGCSPTRAAGAGTVPALNFLPSRRCAGGMRKGRTVLACGAVRVLFVPACWGWAVFVGVSASPKPVVCPFISLKGSCMVYVRNLQFWCFHSSQLLNTHCPSVFADLLPPS